MNKTPEFDFHKPFLVSLLVIVVFVFGFGVMGKTQNNVQQNSATVTLSKTTTTAGPPNPGQTVAQKVFLIGGNNGTSNVHEVWLSSNLATSNWTLTNGNHGSACTLPSAYSPRPVYFKDKLWIIGGRFGLSSICSSVDGINWQNIVVNAPWPARVDHTVLVFGNTLWIIGGQDGNGNPFNDVWKSSDGVNWTQVTASTAWSPRFGHTSVVFNNKMWVMGGDPGPSGGNNDVWFSLDGLTWAQATASAGWTPRRSHSSVVFDGRMWVIGGLGSSGDKNDVWSSVDGINWIQATANSTWAVRHSHASIIFDNKMWVIGGMNNSPTSFNNSYYSTDGISWSGSNPILSPWSQRYNHGVVVTPATFGLPDLTITNLTFRNQPIHISTTNPYVYYDVTVKNSSTIPVVLPATGNTFQINLTSIPSAVSSGDLATITVGTPITLQPGQSHTFSNVSTRYDSRIRATARTYRITAKADALNRITELNETNNTYATNLTIIP
jgi:hypothetical protein